MAIPDHEISPGQESLVGRAKVVTHAQFHVAREIAHRELGTDPNHPPHEVLLAVVQILATNYLASVTKANG